MSEIVLRTNGLCKKYGSRLALDHVDMEIERGAIYGFIGRNGAGKTTLMKIVGGLAAPTSGGFELMGARTPGELQQARTRVGAMIEMPALYPDLTAYGNMEVQRRILGAAGKNLVDDALQLAGLTDTGKKKVKAFSLGMKQRLGLALALLGQPDFLLLDEPINGMDPYGIAEVRETLKRLARERKITILISSHILSELHQLATHYGIIDGGKLVEQLSAEELEQKCRQYVRLMVTDAAACTAVLEEKLGCTNYKAMPGGEIQVYDFIGEPERISAALGAAGIGIKSMSVMGRDLESYYINLLGGGQHE